MAVLLGTGARGSSSIRSSRLRRATVGIAVLGVIATYGVINPSWASAATVTGSNFEIDADANLVVDGGAPAIDWLTGGTGTGFRAGVDVQVDLPSGQTDDAFTGGTKNNSAVPVVDTGSVPPNKSDLRHFGSYVEKNAAGTFVNVFWTRVQDPNGTTAMDFEFNQSAVNDNTWGPNPPPYFPAEVIPTRTPGDLLVTYELENGGVNPVLMRRSWLASDEWGPATTYLASQAIGSINTTAIPANQAGTLGALDARTFGEASINLAALVPSRETCITFGSVYVKSRSSHVLDEALKDFVAPVPTSVSNCGSITIHKTDDNGALAGAGFTLYEDVDPFGGSRGAGDTVVVDTCTTDANGDCSFTDVKKGQYWVVETTVPAAHDAAPDQHVIITEGDQVVPLTFNDPIQYGSITVIKDAVPNDAQDFTFSLDGSSFSLDDDADGTLPSSRTFQVVVGTHSLSETNLPSGWENTNLVCVDPTSNTTTARPDATVRVAKDETVTCTYTNTYVPTAPGLATTAAVTQANTSWNDTATLTGDGTQAVTGSVAFYVCGPTPVAADCTSTSIKVGTDVAVSNGSATTSTPFTPSAAGWYCFRAAYTSSSPYYADTAHTNSTTECFLKRNANLTVTKTAAPAFGRAYVWDVAKVVDGDDSVEVPAGTTHAFPYKVTVSNTHTDGTWTVTGQITVHNPNSVTFAGVDVTDAIDNGAGACSVPGGSDVDVPPAGVVLDYTCTYASAPSPAVGTNTATATWDAAAYFTTASSALGTAAVDFGAVEPSTSDQVVTVTDTLQGVLGTLDAATAQNPTVYSYSVEQTAPEGSCASFPNTASLTTVRSVTEGLQVSQEVVTLDSASASVTLCGGLPLGVGATAGGSLDRTFLWLIDKSVDDTDVTIDNGQTATFAYTVTVTPNGEVDSGYALSGTVTVDNPNDWEDITANVTVGTDLGGGADCAVVDGEDVVIPKGDGVSFAYSCTFTGTPALTGTVTATATWDAAAAATSASSASAPVPVSLVVATETDRTITVTDDKTDPANPVQLGTWTFDDGAHAFTYSLTKAGVASTCTDYTNIATIVETQQSDTQVVTLCSVFTGGGGGPVVNPPQGGGLPFTGDALGLLARTALALLGAGLVLLVLSRRSRRTA
ncbi:MAG TPA: prealbumin-like fold domain-containing protein [Mycobacteriales bacterium]|nr:prealbumin-like fold domain-containing protein [Mycobacteriales bacterium]